jgi:hypothetical protein
METAETNPALAHLAKIAKEDAEKRNQQAETTTTTEPVTEVANEAAKPTEVVTQAVTEVVAETTTEVTTEENKKTLFDLLNPTEQISTEEAPKAEVDADLTKKMQELESEIVSYKEKVKYYEENPLMKALDYGADPDKLKQIAKELVGTDYSHFNYEQLFTMELENNPKYKKLSEAGRQEAIAAELAEFETLHEYKKIEREDALRGKFSTKTESETLKVLESAFQAQQEAAKNQPNPIELAQNIMQVEIKQIDDLGKQLDGYEMNGVKFDNEALQKIKNRYDVDAVKPYLNKEGVLNTKKFILDSFILENYETLIKNAKEEGRKEALKQVTNPDKTTIGTSILPQNVNQFEENAKRLGIHIRK